MLTCEMSIAMFDYQRITFRYEVEIGLHEFAWRVRSDFCVFLIQLENV